MTEESIIFNYTYSTYDYDYFKIDEEYSKLVRPLNPKEDQDLEKSLKENEQKEDVVVDQHGTIIEGHNRFYKLRKLQLPIKYRVKYFEDRFAAKEYIIIVNKDRRQSYPFDKIEDAYKLHQIYQERARLRKLSNLKNVNLSSGPKEPNDKDKDNISVEKEDEGEQEEKGRVNDLIAKRFSLTTTQYKRGKKIIEEGTEEQKQKLRNGQSTVTKESNIIDTKKKIEKLIIDAQKYKLSDKCQIHHADFREIIKNIPDNSIGLILTDPPYENTPENLRLWEDFGRLLIPKLKPGCTTLFLVGGVIVEEIFVRFYQLKKSGLRFWWEHAMEHTGASAPVHEYGIEAKHKKFLGYMKEGGKEKLKPDSLIGLMPDWFKSTKPDKSLHKLRWNQSQIEAEHFIKSLTVENDIVFDPFMGSGTFGIAALKLGRQFIGCEIDKQTFQTAEAYIKVALGGPEIDK